MAAKTKKETWAENPVEGSACVLPRRISNPLKDINVEIGGRLAPAKSIVKAASWSVFEVGVVAASAGAAVAASKKVVVTEAGAAAAASKKVTAEEAGAAAAASKKVASEEAGAAAAASKKVTAEAGAPGNNKAAAREARANKKAIKKANKAAAAAQAAAKKPYHFPVPSDEYFNLWEDPKDREEIRASFTRIAELFAQ